VEEEVEEGSFCAKNSKDYRFIIMMSMQKTE
jgi:hypothetical protein